MVKILAIGDPHGKLPKNLPRKNIDLILLAGDIGKSDLARKIYLINKLNGIEPSAKEEVAAHKEIYDSTIKLLKKLSQKNEVYLIMGNVGRSWSKLIQGIKKIKRVHVAKNSLRKLSGLRIGFLEYFADSCWIKEFEEKDKKRIRRARKETAKAKKVLARFGKSDVDILVCHQPPYGVLDKVGKKAPKHWKGKHAGSKIILNYIKKHSPRYVICGHIHEAAGERKIGKTKVINLGERKYRVIKC
ncbi:hypothetical protein CMI37_17105 [Candidatus Pacearchaeota archaeon]|nr:hypothetical protein [Candidatus Pacearchaeota archaeon]|tara:strand:- start:1096 stop:1827 length:732 start_codon:yes stop_codon:yes gene_type:complete